MVSAVAQVGNIAFHVKRVREFAPVAIGAVIATAVKVAKFVKMDEELEQENEELWTLEEQEKKMEKGNTKVKLQVRECYEDYAVCEKGDVDCLEELKTCLNAPQDY